MNPVVTLVLAWLVITQQVLHNSCNTGTRGLPDTVCPPSTLTPVAPMLQVDISGRPLMPMLQL